MKFDPSHTAKQALIKFVKERAGHDITNFNEFWGTRCKSFDQLKSLTELTSANEEQIQVKHDFLKLIAERYFSITSGAIRDADPNHMVMGARFAGTGGADPVVCRSRENTLMWLPSTVIPKPTWTVMLLFTGGGVKNSNL